MWVGCNGPESQSSSQRIASSRMPNKGWWALLPKVWASCLSAIILLQSIPTTYQEELAIANLKEQEGTLTLENMTNVGISRFAACYKHHVQGEEARMHRDYRKLNVDFADPHEVNAVDLVDAHISRTHCSINFFMVWSTVASSFSPRDFRSVESVFKQHPGACVVVFSSTIDGQLFTPLHRLGYQVIVVPLDVHNLLLGTKAEQWLASLHRWREQRNFYSNISNAVRKAALLRWGGVYIDFDVIVLKPITVRNALAWMDTEVWLNGGVMAFDAGHKFLEMCLEDFAKQYDGSKWGHNGPSLLTRVWKRYQHTAFMESDPLHILPSSAFYPISNSMIKYAFTRNRTDIVVSQLHLLENAFVLHYFNNIMHSQPAKPGSAMDYAFHCSCVLCFAIV